MSRARKTYVHIRGDEKPWERQANDFIESGIRTRVGNFACSLLVLFGALFCFYQFLIGELGNKKWLEVGKMISGWLFD